MTPKTYIEGCYEANKPEEEGVEQRDIQSVTERLEKDKMNALFRIGVESLVLLFVCGEDREFTEEELLCASRAIKNLDSILDYFEDFLGINKEEGK